MLKESHLQTALKYKFKDPAHLVAALTHKSFHFEAKTKSHNEVLEFLGDSVLSLIVSEYLIEKFPQCGEGDLSRMRAMLVNEASLARIGEALGLTSEIRLGRGEKLSGGQKKPRLLASAFEATVGALFLDGGYRTVRSRIRRLFKHLVEEINPTSFGNLDFKTRLQEVLQRESKKTPIYETRSEQGPAHNREFEVNVLIQGVILATGSGKSKKAAEQDAAQKALHFLQQQGRV